MALTVWSTLLWTINHVSPCKGEISRWEFWQGSLLQTWTRRGWESSLSWAIGRDIWKAE